MTSCWQVLEASGHVDALDKEADAAWVSFMKSLATHPILKGQRLLDLLTEPCQRAIRYSTEAAELLKAATSGDPTRVMLLFVCHTLCCDLRLFFNFCGSHRFSLVLICVI